MIRHTIIIAAGLAVPGCAQAQPPAAAPAGTGCPQHVATFPRLLGGTDEAARAALLALPGIALVRVVGPDQPVTTDFRPDRATVLVRDGKVGKITCG